VPVEIHANGYGGLWVERRRCLRDVDLDAVNTKDAHDRVKPAPLARVRAGNGEGQGEEPASWNTIRMKAL
jgi:alpha-N-arabinofuranosidase